MTASYGIPPRQPGGAICYRGDGTKSRRGREVGHDVAVDGLGELDGLDGGYQR